MFNLFYEYILNTQKCYFFIRYKNSKSKKGGHCTKLASFPVKLLLRDGTGTLWIDGFIKGPIKSYWVTVDRQKLERAPPDANWLLLPQCWIWVSHSIDLRALFPHKAESAWTERIIIFTVLSIKYHPHLPPHPDLSAICRPFLEPKCIKLAFTLTT